MSSRLVYSSGDGRVPQPKPKGPRSKGGEAPVPLAPDDGWVRLWRTKSGRGGKTATVITGLPGTDADVERLAVELRRFVGAGGAIRDGAVEVQGDHRKRIQKRLTELGFRVKLAGG
jgi:translation initiation factor 1